MLDHGVEWLELAVRWIHIITGIAWIGTSFYFNWLNHSLETPEDAPDGVSGELWQIHGGGFYHVRKYAVAPERLPKTLHWFKWEAYSTWISGFAMLVLVYYMGADAYLLDADSSPVGAPAAIGIGIGTLIAGWFLYDLLCKSPLGKTQVPFTLVAFALTTAAAWALTLVFTSRGAYMHIGAMLGTVMAANVFRVIIPSQKDMVAAMEEDRAPDAALGKKAATRSLHNNYITLPVLFVMVSSHYPMTWGHAQNWLLLAALSVIGAGTRHYFNLKHQGRHKVWILPAAAAAMVGLALVTARPSPGEASVEPPDGGGIAFETVASVISRRCLGCHSETPTHDLFSEPPRGITLTSKDDIRSQLDKIRSRVLVTRTMPPGNVTGMTETERALIERWLEQGAPME